MTPFRPGSPADGDPLGPTDQVSDQEPDPRSAHPPRPPTTSGAPQPSNAEPSPAQTRPEASLGIGWDRSRATRSRPLPTHLTELHLPFSSRPGVANHATRFSYAASSPSSPHSLLILNDAATTESPQARNSPPPTPPPPPPPPPPPRSPPPPPPPPPL